ncbi:MAG: potassium channel family protein [Candidatus Geothermincolia bacterium]
MRARRRIDLAALIVLALLGIGTAGYMLIEDMSLTQGLYMTVITISTVGFREVKALGTGGMYFTIFLIVSGVGSLFFLLGGLLESLLEGLFGEFLGRRRMSQRITKMEGHYIICGYGRVGENVARELARTGKQFTILERENEGAAKAMRAGYPTIRGDSTSAEVLEEAGVRRAAGLVSALHNDADNLLVTLTAHSLNPDLFIVTRSVYPESVEKLRFAGANRIISPYELSGRRMATLLLSPAISDFLDIVAQGGPLEFRLAEFEVGQASELAGKLIGDSAVKSHTGAMILAVRKDPGHLFDTNPDKNTLLEAGDLLIAMGTGEQLSELERVASG